MILIKLKWLLKNFIKFEKNSIPVAFDYLCSSAVVDIFNEVKKTLPKPVILFIDDFECLLNESEKISPEACRRITTELLVQIDDCDKQPGNI